MRENDAQTGTWTVARLLEWTRDYLTKHGVESPRLCAELLLAKAMNCERLQLYTRHDFSPDGAVRDCFRASVRDAAGGKPIAYIIGTKEFFSLSFEVTPAVLIPRPETEILVERAIDIARNASSDKPLRLLDVGTGSGCIPIAIARHVPNIELTATDVSAEAVAVARRNAERLGVTDRIDFRVGDLFGAIEPSQRFDIIVSNPPYVATRDKDTLPVNVRDFEPHAALFAGEEGLDVIERLIHDAPAWLGADGHFLMEIAYDQADAVRIMLSNSQWRQIAFYRDAGGHQRVAAARRTEESRIQVA
jgi:release factor glutamine methyltransferase